MFNAGREFEYEVDHRCKFEDDQEVVRRKDYRRGRSSYRPARRRSRKSASHPGFGIAGRRNRRWSW